MDFRILGPLEVLDRGRPLGLGGRKQRAMLALLLLHAGEAVSTDRLVDELWGERPPATAAKLVQGYVAALRKLLPDGVLVTRAPGYLLGLDGAAHSLDLRRFATLVAEAKGAPPERAVGLFREALAIWRGQALGDVWFGGLAASEAAGLNDSRLVVLTQRIELELALGRHADLVGELESLVAEHPFQERLRAQLILALYRSGRQAEALEAYRDARRALDELGIEPSAELGRLEKAILTQDEGLEPPQTPRAFQLERRDDAYAVMPPSRVATQVVVADAPSKLPTSSPSSWEQRKTVTVLFCDVTGSTALAESVDPEVLRALLARYFERMQAIVARHGGVVEKFIGDAVMAVFGVPRAHEDDALRAVRAAVEMRDALPELGIQARIGVNTGEVVTGTEERLATGDAVNVAARLEQTASPGEVLLGQATLALVREAVEVEALEPLELKGKGEPAPAYRVVSVHEAPERRHETPFVGRAGELETLRQAWQRVRDERRCELVTVVGDAGVGKSRLTAEFLASVGAPSAGGRCLPYGEGITYWPVVEAIRQLDALPSDPAAAAAIRSLLRETDEQASAEEIAWAFRKLLEEQAPLICVFDDIQWGEETLLDLIEHVALLSSGAPVLLLCLARPDLVDRRATWPVSLRLEPLSDEDVDQLIPREISSGRRTRITRAAGGNPLFVSGMLAMTEAAGADVAVPPTLNALLAARLDQLEPAERRVLEAAAVEGEVFHRGAVASLAREEPQITPWLASLVRKQLIRPHTPHFPGDDGFRFRHLLIRDAAYASLTKSSRAELHQRFAAWLEPHGRELVELDEIVGYHLEQAVRYQAEVAQPEPSLAERAGDHLAAAGRRALFRGDHHAAASLLQRAADLTRPLRLDIHLELCLAVLQRDSRDAELALEVAADRAHAKGDETSEALARAVAGTYRTRYSSDFSLDELELLARRAVPGLEQADDHAGLVHAWLALQYIASIPGHFEDGADAAEEAIRHARLAEERSTSLFGLPWMLVSGPQPADEALRRLDAALDENPQAGPLLARSCLLAMLGRFDNAWATATAAAEQGRERTGDGMLPVIESVFAYIAALEGDAERAAEHMRRQCDLLESHRDRNYLSTQAPTLGRFLCKLGRYDEAEPLARLGRELGNIQDYETQIVWRQVQALVHAHHGEHARAERLAREAVAIGDRTDALNSQGDALCDLAEVLRAAGGSDAAASALGQALERYGRKKNLAMAAQVRARMAALQEEPASA